jgi:hypothetical protein
VISGVRQGTVLGPLLFLLYVNDMDQAVNFSNLRMFADDSRLVKSINPDHPEEDSRQLTLDLQSVLVWADKNNMQLNTSKFEFLSYKVNWQAPNNNMRLLKQLPFAYVGLERSYDINHNVELLESDVVTDLGINITNSFSFTVHINRIAKKAKGVCNVYT